MDQTLEKISTKNKYFVYMIRCADDTIYTGITTNVERRYQEHKSHKGAKYTRVHGVNKIEAVFSCSNRSYALKLEYAIKQLNRSEKENVIVNKSLELLKDRIDLEEYNYVKNHA